QFPDSLTEWGQLLLSTILCATSRPPPIEGIFDSLGYVINKPAARAEFLRQARRDSMFIANPPESTDDLHPIVEGDVGSTVHGRPPPAWGSRRPPVGDRSPPPRGKAQDVHPDGSS